MNRFVVPEAGWYVLDKDGWRKAEPGELDAAAAHERGAGNHLRLRTPDGPVDGPMILSA